MSSVQLRQLGRADYETTWHAMQAFTLSRTPQTPDEVWLTEHAPVYTLGLNRRAVRLPTRQDIPLVMVDRGGKITYHGPGQIVVYLLLDLKRNGWNIRQLVSAMENVIIALLAEFDISAIARADAPGVYVGGRKIASLGLRLKNGCSYHGLAFNVDMDLSPFLAIDPCGYQGLQVTQLRDLGIQLPQNEIADRLLRHIMQQLNDTETLVETA
ncbi:MAG TPA: lipoyl(octanoyl) transferase LipB [Methylophilaceae bacterium]|nr:lipoyl(octanoyl) transferase LipB [Methylophilaceae bacterium]